MSDGLETITLAEAQMASDSNLLCRIQHEFVINTAPETILAQVHHNVGRGLPELAWLPARPEGEHILSLCGAAPSLMRTIGELTGKVMAFNAAIPALTKAGIVVDYPMIWDATPEMVRYACDIPQAQWMIASRCHPDLIDALLALGQRVTLWHTAGDDAVTDFLGPQRLQVHGGSTAIGRGVFLGVWMGFYDLHAFGVDSSFEGEETHVGGALRAEKEVLMVVDGTHQAFRTTTWMMNQADEWQSFVLPTLVASGIGIDVHGDGLLPFVHRLWMGRRAHAEKMLRLAQEAAA